MFARLKAAIIVLLAVAWPAVGMAQPGPACVQSGIAAGGDHTCAFTTPGSAMCWGDNSFGQNGNGTFNTPTPVPTVVVPSSLPGQPPPFQLVAGQRHTCATLLPGGIAVCWGDDTSGQLGDGRSGAGVFSPTEVPVVDPNTARPLSAVFAVAAGDQHSCALICPNQPCNVRCWGDNTVGQLGIGSAGGTSATPSNPVTFPPTPFIPANPPPVAITAGGLHTCAVMQDNTARCWGDNSFGQIGNCSTPRSTAPTPATVNYGGCPTTALLADVVQIAAGESHSCALLSGPVNPSTGNVACWGTGGEGELGNPGTAFSATPAGVVDSSGAPSSRLSGVKEIAAGSFHTCALMKKDGSVQCWGSNSNGQLGPKAPGNCRPSPAATTSCSESPVPVTIDAAGTTPLSGVVHIAAGASHTCAALSSGDVLCWGNNSFDQLGASTAPNTRSATPVAVGGLCNCPGPIMACNGQCTDTTSDPQNCGGCNNTCITGDRCVASACQCPGTLCPAPGPTQVCADTTRDPNNCGACGRVCSGGKICVDSACVCPSGQTICGGRCVDLQTDNNNCGRCGRRCRISPPCNREEEVCTTCENGDCVAF